MLWSIEFETYGGETFSLICTQKVAKEGGEKWKSMTDEVSNVFFLLFHFLLLNVTLSLGCWCVLILLQYQTQEKKPYLEKSLELKAEYVKVLEKFNAGNEDVYAYLMMGQIAIYLGFLYMGALIMFYSFLAGSSDLWWRELGVLDLGFCQMV